MKALSYLKTLESDMIDGVESGINTVEEKEEVRESIESIDELLKDLEYSKYHNDSLVSVHKKEIQGISKRTCENCIYVNKINMMTYSCRNNFSPIYDTIIDKQFCCNLYRGK